MRVNNTSGVSLAGSFLQRQVDLKAIRFSCYFKRFDFIENKRTSYKVYISSNVLLLLTSVK